MTFTGAFRLDPLILKGVPEDRLHDEWKEWKRALEHILLATGVKEESKFSSLMAYGGKDLQKIYYSFEDPKPEYKYAIETLDAYFKPKQHAIFARHKFWEIERDPDESIDDLVIKLRSKAELCVFGNSAKESLEIAMMDKLIMLMPQDLKEKLLQKDNLSFSEAIKLIKAHDAAKSQARQLTNSNPPIRQFSNVNQVRLRQNGDCYRCGSKTHKADSDRCPARRSRCHNCGREGHFMSVCRDKRGEKRNRPYEKENFTKSYSSEPSRKKRKFEVRNLENSERESDVLICEVNSDGVIVVCEIGGLSVGMLVDSGTSKNIVDEKTWQLMRANGFRPKREFYDKTVTFSGYGNCALKQLIAFEADISVKKKTKLIVVTTIFYVIKNGSRPLLSKGKRRIYCI